MRAFAIKDIRNYGVGGDTILLPYGIMRVNPLMLVSYTGS